MKQITKTLFGKSKARRINLKQYTENGIAIIEVDGIEYITIHKEGTVKEPVWFTKFRIENNKRWEENNRRWNEQMKFNNKVFEFMEDQKKFNKLLLSLPTIQKEIKEH